MITCNLKVTRFVHALRRPPVPELDRSGRSERHAIQIDQLAEFGVGWVLGFD
jgi:hypothetical protein